ncbi:juvenile hormone epoxide hydrolase-like [Trichoplusia ni]|uniref:Epoxide hydrolase n=1 Tax=Trichoplusia ni TaxID=7111 RepID=A0A7E5WBH2_TRINI|nr:juvenile hormone epoxide hydrolase-like [Trichoplusia ni]
MGGLTQVLVFCAVVVAVRAAMIESNIPLPDENAWWGPGAAEAVDTSIRPFKISFEEKMIEDLRYRLKNHRPFTPPLEDAGFNYGFNTAVLNDWVSYWANSYNFTERENYMNLYPQFKTNIQGLDIHFVRVKPEVPAGVEVLPILMLHGWPATVLEFYKVIPLLTEVSEERGYALELIIPSLPGFGFSDATNKQGLGATEMAVIFRNLMHRLGHEKFYIHGGDWGAYICFNLASLFPDEVYGYHTNYGISFSPASWITWFMGSFGEGAQNLVVEKHLAGRLYPTTSILKELMTKSGYLHIQATKPDTIGVGMSDSPSGLLAYVFQFVSMAVRIDNINKTDGGLLDHYTREELLDNLMVYWMQNNFNTACRIYAETLNMRNLNNGWFSLSTPVPVYLIQADNDLLYMSTPMLQHIYTNIVHNKAIDGAGHFLASEKPELFSNSVYEALDMFRKQKDDCKDEL